MSKTQDESLKEIKKSGRSETLRDEIVEFVSKNEGLSRREIADNLGQLLNSVTARIREAILKSELEERGVKKCSETGKLVARIYVATSERKKNALYDIESKTEIIKVFKLLAKVQDENQKQFEQVMRVLNLYFNKKVK